MSSYGARTHPDRSTWSSQKDVPKRDVVEPSGYWPEVPLSGTLMQKLSYFHLSAASLAFAALVGVEARSTELEGALQYPPPSVGEGVQPPRAG
jgi:hypothetical protein